MGNKSHLTISVIGITHPGSSSLRHRSVPQRVVGTQIVVARPADGKALVLSSTAAEVWIILNQWRTEADLQSQFNKRYSDVDPAERSHALGTTLELFVQEGLLEPSRP